MGVPRNGSGRVSEDDLGLELETSDALGLENGNWRKFMMRK